MAAQDQTGPVPSPRNEWSPLPFEGCVGVEGRVLLDRDTLVVASLRFSHSATIHEHAAPFAVDVVCLEGSGHVSVGDETFAFRAGQTILWPPGVAHRLWTQGGTMVTLMLERRDQR